MTQTPPILEIVAVSDVGRARELNEDSVRAVVAASTDAGWQLAGVLIIADGMGGHHAGEVASGLAADALEDFFAQPPDPTATLDGRELLVRLDTAVRQSNATVFAQAAPELGGLTTARPGTTLTACLLRADEYCIGHVGDSRAYLLRDDDGIFSAEQITDDDSFVAEAVRRGHMTLTDARTSPLRHQITKAVGLEPEVEPALYYGHWQVGEVLLLCSDGLTEYVEDEELAATIFNAANLEAACAELIALANARGGGDNISLCAARHAASTLTPTGTRKSPTLQPEEIAVLENLQDENLKNEEAENRALKTDDGTLGATLREVRDSIATGEDRLRRSHQIRRRNDIAIIVLLVLFAAAFAAWLWQQRAASHPTLPMPTRTHKKAALGKQRAASRPTPPVAAAKPPYKIKVDQTENGDALKIMGSPKTVLKVEILDNIFRSKKISDHAYRLDFVDAKQLAQLKQKQWTLACAPVPKNVNAQKSQIVWRKSVAVQPGMEYSLLAPQQSGDVVTWKEWAHFRLTPTRSTDASR